MTDHVTYAWHVVGATERGASHERSGAPNQDAFAYKTFPGAANGLRTVMAVSDGHGSPKCVRSDVGSRLAVEAALGCGERFFDGVAAVDKRRFENDFPSMLVATWRDAVTNHARETPLIEAEYDKLNAGAGARAVAALREAAEQGDGAALHLAYGATILLVVVADHGIFYAQVGDGDILAVSAEGEVEPPIPEDPSLIANEVTSLCMRDAVRQFRFGFHHIEKEPPALILVSTDGYGNAFASPQDFYKVGTDVLRMIQEAGMPTAAEIAPWLDAASRQGSGDDVTLGILCRADMVARRRPITPTPPAKVADTLTVEAPSAPSARQAEVAVPQAQERPEEPTSIESIAAKGRVDE